MRIQKRHRAFASVLFTSVVIFGIGHAQPKAPASQPTSGRSAYTSPSTHRVNSSGVSISYRVFGQGRPLLIINGGFGSDSVGFEGLAQSLSSSHQVILYDRRGVGQSPMDQLTQETMTMALLVADIEAIRRDLKVTSWSVLGHSFGGMLAAHYTALHPTRVNTLILSSSAGVDLTLLQSNNKEAIHAQLSPDDLSALKRLEAAYRAGDHGTELLEQFSEILARAYVVNDAWSPWVARRLRSANKKVGQLLSDDLKRIGFDAKPALRRFKRPVLIIQGRRDVMIEDIAQTTHKLFSDSRLVILDEAGHYGWLDQPQAYLSEVLKLLALPRGQQK